MRISERKYPLLKFLRNPDLGIGLKMPDSEKQSGKAWAMWDDFFTDAKVTAPWFAEHIDIVSMPFMHAAWENRKRILTVETLRDLLKEPIHGVLIAGGFIIVYYYMQTENHDIGHKAITCYNDLLISINTGAGKYLVPRDYFAACGHEVTADDYDSWPLLFHLFKKYAEVETIEAMKNKKVNLPDGDRLLVESDLRMAYTDCSWFREIIRKEGFLVSGHFRLQPCKKDGEWTKKLIYIEPYQKHGYTRKARIQKTLPVVN